MLACLSPCSSSRPLVLFLGRYGRVQDQVVLLPQRNRIAKFDLLSVLRLPLYKYYSIIVYDPLPPPPPRVLAAAIVSVPRVSPCSSTYYPCGCVGIPGFRQSNVQVPPSSYSIPLLRRTRCPGTSLCCRYRFWSLPLWRPFFRTLEVTSRGLPCHTAPPSV